MTAFCQSCKAPVIWAHTEKGRRMPVDDKADPNGNLFLAHIGSSPTPVAIYLKGDEEPPGGACRRTSHFATCPHADRHRKR